LHKRSFRALVFFAIAIAFAAAIGATQAPRLLAAGEYDNIGSGSWSNPTIWRDSRIPRAGDHVMIGMGTEVVYDIASQEEIGSIEIHGKLIFSRSVSTNLDVGGIMVHPHGLLEIGTRDNPIPGNVTAAIRIINPDDTGENGIMVMGEAQVHGQPIEHVYTHLVEDAPVGSDTIVVESPVDWQKGDRIVLASTTTRPKDTEDVLIKSVNGNEITLRRPLRNWHGGTYPAQAEVANLTRNVLITSKDKDKRGHTMFHHGATGGISYAEFANLGAERQLGRYPIHFHMVGDSMAGTVVEGVSVHDSGNRFITLHSSNGIVLRRNVGYNAIGHGFFLENGDETGNVFEGNLGILVKSGKILKDDASPAVFWIVNPVNTLVDNTAVGSMGGNGFHLRLRGEEVESEFLDEPFRAPRLPVTRFENNEAHSNTESGLRVYVLHPETPSDASTFQGIKAWRNQDVGVWMKARYATIADSHIFGNGNTNFELHGDGNTVRNSLFEGSVGSVPQENAANAPVSSRGFLFHGEDNRIIDSGFSGHETSGESTGTDIGLLQDEKGPASLSITGTTLGSERPVIFGYPSSSQTYIEIGDSSLGEGSDMLLFRLDAPAPNGCEPEAHLQLMANVCISDR
jgi:hypothetical protein